MNQETKKHKYIFDEIPDGYKEYVKIDLLEEREIIKTLSRTEIILAGLLFLLGLKLVPLSTFTHGNDVAIKVIVTIGSFIAFLVVREIVHSSIMKLFGVNQIEIELKKGFSAISYKSYFKKTAYGIITLLPIIIMGVGLAVICTLVPREMFWCVYPALIANFAGSSADYYVAYLFTKVPKDTIVLDEGTTLTFYFNEKTSA